MPAAEHEISQLGSRNTDIKPEELTFCEKHRTQQSSRALSQSAEPSPARENAAVPFCHLPHVLERIPLGVPGWDIPDAPTTLPSTALELPLQQRPQGTAGLTARCWSPTSPKLRGNALSPPFFPPALGKLWPGRSGGHKRLHSPASCSCCWNALGSLRNERKQTCESHRAALKVPIHPQAGTSQNTLYKVQPLLPTPSPHLSKSSLLGHIQWESLPGQALAPLHSPERALLVGRWRRAPRIRPCQNKGSTGTRDTKGNCSPTIRREGGSPEVPPSPLIYGLQ